MTTTSSLSRPQSLTIYPWRSPPLTNRSRSSRCRSFDGVEITQKVGPPAEARQQAQKQPKPPAQPPQPTIHLRPTHTANPPLAQCVQGPMKPLHVPGKTSEEHKFKYQSPSNPQSTQRISSERPLTLRSSSAYPKLTTHRR